MFQHVLEFKIVQLLLQTFKFCFRTQKKLFEIFFSNVTFFIILQNVNVVFQPVKIPTIVFRDIDFCRKKDVINL